MKTKERITKEQILRAIESDNLDMYEEIIFQDFVYKMYIILKITGVLAVAGVIYFLI